MPWENPGAYDEARKRIRENKERETIVIEERKESFEKGKEKIRSKKKLDVHELQRRIETGRSLDSLKSEIKEALRTGDISIDTYSDVLEHIEDKEHEKRTVIKPEYIFDPQEFPLANHPVTQFFERQKLGDNIVIDMAGFVYWVAQGSLFLLWLAGKITLDLLLLPVDIYKMMKH